MSAQVACPTSAAFAGFGCSPPSVLTGLPREKMAKIPQNAWCPVTALDTQDRQRASILAACWSTTPGVFGLGTCPASVCKGAFGFCAVLFLLSHEMKRSPSFRLTSGQRASASCPRDHRPTSQRQKVITLHTTMWRSCSAGRGHESRRWTWPPAVRSVPSWALQSRPQVWTAGVWGCSRWQRSVWT